MRLPEGFTHWLRSPKEVLSLFVPLSISAGLLLWIAMKGYANFDSDQSLAGLMALHMEHGEFAAYPWGQSYFGVIFLPFTLLSMHVFGETSVVALRIPMIGFSLLFEIVLYAGIRRLWDTRTAFVSLMFMAIPGFHMMRWFGFHVYPIYGIAAFTMLWVVLTRHTLMRSTVAGVMAGFGVWTSPVFTPYIFFAVALAVRSMAEWPTLLHVLKKKKWLTAAVTIAILWAIGYVVWPLIMQDPHRFWSPLLKGVAVAAGIFCLLLFLISKQKGRIGTHIGCVLGGAFLGALPMIQYIIDTGTPASLGMYAFLPSWNLVRAFIRVVIPTTLGLPPILSQVTPVSPLEDTIYGIATFVAFGFLVAGVMQALPAVRKFFSTKEMTEREMTLFFAFGIFVMTYVGGFIRAAHVEGQTRFLIDVFATNAFFMALGWNRVWMRWRRTAMLLLIALLAVTLFGTYRLGHGPGDQTMKPVHVGEIHDFLTEHEVSGGYANYWTAFALTYFLHEDTVLAPYNGNNRYPPYVEAAGRSNPYAIVLNRSDDARIPDGTKSIDVLRKAIKDNEVIPLPYFAYAQERLDRGSVVDRRRMGNWDVWILVDKTPPAVK